MKRTFSRKISFMRLLGGVVVSYAPRFTVYRNAGAPTALVRNDANETGLVSFVWAPYVLRISVRKHHPQVGKTVVVFDPVEVVYHPFGPCSGHVQPDQTMRFIKAAAQAYKDVALVVSRACHIAYVHGLSYAFCPSKKTSIGVVVQYATNVVCGKIRDVHAVAPVKQWFGKWVRGAATPYTGVYVNSKITGLQA